MNRQEYINAVLIPAMFQRADTLFGEKLHFAQYAQGWRTRTHLNGIDVDSHPKTVWRANTPFYIKDWGTGPSGPPKCAKQGSGGGHNAEVVALYAEFFCGGDRNAAVERLLEECKLVDDYKEKVKPYAKNTDKELTQRHTDMKICDDLFRQTFKDKDNLTTQRAVDYLTKRGWTEYDIEESGVGVIDAATKAKVPQGYAMYLNDAISKTHIIAIPLRVDGRVDRFHFRNCGEHGAKYYKENKNRFSEKKQLFGTWNFVGTNIVVEGVLDYLHARAFGINVLLSEGAPADTQIIHAAKHNAKSFTLLFDADTAGWGYTQRMGKALMVAGKDVKVATLPPLDVPEVQEDGTTTTRRTWFNDTDDWLCAVNKIISYTGEEREEYVELLLEAVRNAVPYDVWRAEVLERWFVMQVLDVEPQHPDVNNITTDVVDRVCRAAKNEYCELFVEHVAKLLAATTGTVHASRVEVVFRKWEEGFKREAARAQEAQAKNEEPVKTPFLFDLSALQSADGQTYQEEQTDALLDEIKGKKGGSEWMDKYGVLVPQCKTWQEVAKRRAEIKEGVPTMFAFPRTFDAERVAKSMQYIKFFPGLSLLCANTGHGKTSILSAVALYDAERNKVLKNNKVTLYLSFEMEEAVLMADVLNLYNDDPELSNSPIDTLQTFFAEQLYNTENFANFYFNKESVREVQADGTEVWVSHYERFVHNWHKFDTEYLTQGGHLHIAKVNWYYEELLEGLQGYWERAAQPNGEFAGKEISMVCIDYAQLLRSSGFSRQRTEEIKQIVQGLNNFAKDVLHVPIVMCAQFNQQVSNPAKIAINCIGEGGDFSRYADTVIGFYNLEKLPKTEAGEKSVIADLEALGVILPKDAAGLDQRELSGLMFARLLKTRNGSFPMDALMLWDGRIKKLHTNCNRYVVDKDFARAVHKEYNISWEALVSKGRDELTDIGIKMESIAGTRKAPGAKIETFIGALSKTVKGWEDINPLLKGSIEGTIDYKEPEPTAQPDVEGDGMFYADGTPLPQDDDCPF